MNKLFSKIAALTLGLGLAVGVGVALGRNGVQKAEATENDSYSETYDYAALESMLGGDYSDASSYWKVPSAANRQASVAISFGKAYSPVGNISVTLDLACFGSGSDPSKSNTTITAVGSDTSSTWTGSELSSYPSSSSYGDRVLTVTNPNDSTTISGLSLTIGVDSGVKIFRLRSLTVEFEFPKKPINHITAAATKTSGWYVGDLFKTSDVTVTPYYSEDSSDAGIPVTDGKDVKFGEGADQDSVALALGENNIKVNYGEKSANLTVTARNVPVVDGVTLDGDMENKEYAINSEWDYTGLYLTVSWTEDKQDTTVQLKDLTAGTDFTADPTKADSLSLTSMSITGTYQGFNFSKTVTGLTVTLTPTVIEFTNANSAGTKWKPASSLSYTDEAGNAATMTVASGTGYSGSGTPVQIGSSSKPTTYVNIEITLAKKAGVISASATYCSANGAVASVLVYGDDENDVVVSDSVTGNSKVETRTVSDSYQTLNATKLHFNFTCQTGIKLQSISYIVGDTVAEFGVFTNLEVAQEASVKQFKVGDKFSSAGLVLRASDNSEPVITKDYSTGFKVGTAADDDSYADYTFVAADAENSPITVYATLTIKEVTKSIQYQITVTEVPTYSLVASSDSLYEGARVLIVGGGFGIAGHNGTIATPSEGLTVTDNVISDPKDAVEFAVKIYGNRIGLQLGTKYLAYQTVGGEKRKQVYLVDELNDAASWSYTGSSLTSNVSGRSLVYDSTLSPSGFACEDSGTEVNLFISDKSVKNDAVVAETYAYRYLHMRDYLEGDGSCYSTDKGGKGYYDAAKAAFNNLTDDQKQEFFKLTDAVSRLEAWAEANGDKLENGALVPTSSPIGQYIAAQPGPVILIVMGTIAAISFGVVTLLKTKKKDD